MAAKQWRLGDAAASPERGAGNASPRVRGYVNLRWCVAGLQIVAWVSGQPATPLPVELWGAVQPETPLLVGLLGLVQPVTPLLARCGLLWGVLVHRWCLWFRAGSGARRRWCRWFRFVWCCATCDAFVGGLVGCSATRGTFAGGFIGFSATQDASASGIVGCSATRDASVGSLWPVMGCFGSSVVPVVSCRSGCASAVVLP